LGEISSSLNIHDLRFIPLKQLKNDLGSVKHMLKSTDEFFDGFGEIYFSTIFKGVVKGWKKHLEVPQNLVVPCGRVRFIVYDGRENSPSFGQVDEILLCPDTNYGLLKIPNKLWYSFRGEAAKESVIVNCIPTQHDPKECVSKEIFDTEIPYSWRN